MSRTTKDKLLQFPTITPFQWKQLLLSLDELDVEFLDADFEELKLNKWLR